MAIRGSLCTAVLLTSHMFYAAQVQAQLFFHFEETLGGDVTMTASGSIDTGNLLPATNVVWGGIGIQDTGDFDIMGDTDSGQVDVTFAFSPGTDFSPWDAATGPFATDNFGWTSTATRSFHTYFVDPDTGLEPGFGVVESDLEEGVWTPDAVWTLPSETFASAGLNEGTYTVTDAVTGAFITIQVGGVLPSAAPPRPVPALPLWGMLLMTGLLGGFGMRRYPLPKLDHHRAGRGG